MNIRVIIEGASFLAVAKKTQIRNITKGKHEALNKLDPRLQHSGTGETNSNFRNSNVQNWIPAFAGMTGIWVSYPRKGNSSSTNQAVLATKKLKNYKIIDDFSVSSVNSVA